jgi:hypothetical protein
MFKAYYGMGAHYGLILSKKLDSNNEFVVTKSAFADLKKMDEMANAL